MGTQLLSRLRTKLEDVELILNADVARLIGTMRKKKPNYSIPRNYLPRLGFIERTATRVFKGGVMEKVIAWAKVN